MNSKMALVSAVVFLVCACDTPGSTANLTSGQLCEKIETYLMDAQSKTVACFALPTDFSYNGVRYPLPALTKSNCEKRIAKCTTDDVTTINGLVRCYQNVPACQMTMSGGMMFTNAVMNCALYVRNISKACGESLILP